METWLNPKREVQWRLKVLRVQGLLDLVRFGAFGFKLWDIGSQGEPCRIDLFGVWLSKSWSLKESLYNSTLNTAPHDLGT